MPLRPDRVRGGRVAAGARPGRHTGGKVHAVTTRPGRRRSVGLLRGLSGLLAAGTAVLAVALGVGWVLATRSGTAGPGPDTLAWHAGAATVALLAQTCADRRAGVSGTVASVAVVVITSTLLAVQWLY